MKTQFLNLNEDKNDKYNIDNISNNQIKVFSKEYIKSYPPKKGKSKLLDQTRNSLPKKERIHDSRKDLKIKSTKLLKKSFENQNPSFNSAEKLSNNFNVEIIKEYEIGETKKEDIKKQQEEYLSDFELNELEYEEAVNLDKRTFLQIYFSTLKREHIILFTFFSCNDYNLLYIKIARFIILFSTDMAMNVFFFSDESMHKLFLNYGKYNFVQQIPQIVYSTVISQILEVFLCYLSMTDKYIYEMKKLDNNAKKIAQIFKYIRLKLIFFFIFTFLLFMFYWYTVASFCATYQNTQITFIKDSFISFTIGIIYPVIIYLIPSALRLCALKNEKKKLKYVYKLSDLIPFF